MIVALIHEVFHGAGGGERLRSVLREARAGGAELALLPELPLDAWVATGRVARDADAEEPNGPRQRRMADAAREAGVALLGGAIVRDPTTGRRFNRALLFDAAGTPIAAYDKCHLPSEEGYFESDHYEPGQDPPRRIDGLPLALGIQICSDVNRPEGSQLLSADGAEVIAVPRATPAESYGQWRLVLRANALTGCVWVLSPNRPRPEPGVAIGGPSLAVAPDGEVLLESSARVAFVRLERDALSRARRDYPGYLARRRELYARGWSRLAREAGAGGVERDAGGPAASPSPRGD